MNERGEPASRPQSTFEQNEDLPENPSRRRFLKKAVKVTGAVALAAGGLSLINQVPTTEQAEPIYSYSPSERYYQLIEKTREYPNIKKYAHNMLNPKRGQPDRLDYVIGNPDLHGMTLEGDARRDTKYDGKIYIAHEQRDISSSAEEREEYAFENVIKRVINESDNDFEIDVKLPTSDTEGFDQIIETLSREVPRDRNVTLSGNRALLGPVEGRDNFIIIPTIVTYDDYLYYVQYANEKRNKNDNFRYGASIKHSSYYLPYVLGINREDQMKGRRGLETKMYSTDDASQFAFFATHDPTAISIDLDIKQMR